MQKTKRKISSISRSISRFSQRLSTLKPSTFVFTIIAISLTLFLFGGGLYSVIVKPLPAVYYGGRFLFLYPQLSEQFITDSIVATILYSLGVVGLLAIYQSTKYAYKPRQAYIVFLIGAANFLLAYVFLEVIIYYWKGL